MPNNEKELTLEEKLEQALIPKEEQPFEVLGNWCWTNIGSVSDFVRGITFPSSAKEYEKADRNIACIRTANIQELLEIEDMLYVDKSYMKNNENKLVRKDDIIMSSANSKELVGKTSYVFNDLQDTTFGGFVLCIRTKKVVSRFLYYYLKYEFLSGNFMGESTQTTNIANINSKILGKYKFPLPPLAEQKRIVRRIENLFDGLNSAKELVQECLDIMHSRRYAIFEKAFSGKLTERWRKNNKHDNNILNDVLVYYKDNRKVLGAIIACQESSSYIERLSEYGWIKCNIGSIAEISNGSTPSRAVSEYWNGDIHWISSGEVKNNRIWESKEDITQEGFNNSSVRMLPIGTVLIAMIGEGKTRGQSAVLEIEATINQNLAAIQNPHKLVSSEYIWYWLQYQYKRNREKGAGSGPQALNCQRVRELDLILPPLEEQNEIVRVLNSIISMEESAKDNILIEDKLLEIKKSILAKAFRGELSTTNLSEPSSIELLKSILSEKK